MMNALAPATEMSRGVTSFLRGLRWLKAHPRYLLLLFLPMILGIVLLIAGWGVFINYSDSVLSFVMFAKPESFWWGLLYYVAKFLLYVVVFIMGLVFFMLFLNVLSSPVYDLVSEAVEKDLTGQKNDGLALWQSLLLMKEELKKVLFIFVASSLLLLIPGVNLLTPLITAFFVGWEFYDFSLARKGWSFKKRLGQVLRHMWSVTGLGLWLIIPGGQMILMPLAVVGGTMLAVEDMAKRLEKRKQE
ncbi:MAG: EI24 domain-containing protein [Deltaproteobacteria bacterium]|nr:EI24 domain-containing protein [Deltaproteobacteria bacterium]